MATSWKSKKPSQPLSHVFDSAYQKLQRESKGLRCFNQYFEDTRRLFETIGRSVSTLAAFSKQLPEGTSSLRTTAQVMTNELMEFEIDVRGCVKRMQQEVVEPFAEFREHFEDRASGVARQGAAVLDELEEARKRVDKLRRIYMRSAAKLEKAQTVLRSIVDEAKEGSGQTIKDRTNKVLKRQKKTAERKVEYQKAVADSNSLLERKLAQYEDLVDTMLQFDEGRINLLKSLLAKTVAHTEALAKTYATRATSLANVVECVNGQRDLELFVSECDGSPLNELFIPLEFEQYEYK